MAQNLDDIYNEIIGNQDASQRPETSNMSLLDVGRSAVSNLLPSMGRVIGDTGRAIGGLFKGPKDNTITHLAGVGKGAIDAGVNRVKQGLGQDVTHTGSEEQFQAMTDYFKQRYGSLDALKQTIAQDPAGFLLDASSAIDGAGAAVRGAGVATRAGGLARAGEAISGAADTINPLKRASAVVGKAGDMVKAGVQKLTGSDGTIGFGTAQFDKPTADVFAAHGAQPLAGMVTRNRAVQNIYAFAAKYLFGGKLDDRIDALGADVNARAEAIANSVRGDSLNFSNTQLGETINQRFTNYVDNFRRESEQVYAPIVAATAGEAAVAPQTAAALKDILERKGLVLGGDPAAGAFKRISGDLEKAGKNLTVGELRATRSFIGEQMARPGADPAWSHLYGTLSSDITDAVRKVSPELGDKLAAADSAYQQGITTIQEGIGRSITGSGTPEALVKNVIRPSSPTYIRQLRQVVGDDNMELVGTSVLKDIADRASKQVSVPSLEKAGATESLTVVDPQKFLKAVESWPDESLKAALSDEQYTRLKTAVDQMRGVDVMKQAASRTGRTMGGSQTAFSVGNARAILGGSAALGSLLTGNAIPVVTFLGALAGESALTRFLDSPIGYQFFTTGFKPGIAEEYMRSLKRATDVVTNPLVPQLERTKKQ